MTTATEQQILAYWDGTEAQDREGSDDYDPEHRDQLLETLCREAIARDRDMVELIVRAGIERGRGETLLEVIARHRDQVLGTEQARAENEGDITPLRGGPPRGGRR